MILQCLLQAKRAKLEPLTAVEAPSIKPATVPIPTASPPTEEQHQPAARSDKRRQSKPSCPAPTAKRTRATRAATGSAGPSGSSEEEVGGEAPAVAAAAAAPCCEGQPEIIIAEVAAPVVAAAGRSLATTKLLAPMSALAAAASKAAKGGGRGRRAVKAEQPVAKAADTEPVPAALPAAAEAPERAPAAAAAAAAAPSTAALDKEPPQAGIVGLSELASAPTAHEEGPGAKVAAAAENPPAARGRGRPPGRQPAKAAVAQPKASAASSRGGRRGGAAAPAAAAVASEPGEAIKGTAAAASPAPLSPFFVMGQADAAWGGEIAADAMPSAVSALPTPIHASSLSASPAPETVSEAFLAAAPEVAVVGGLQASVPEAQDEPATVEVPPASASEDLPLLGSVQEPQLGEDAALPEPLPADPCDSGLPGAGLSTAGPPASPLAVAAPHSQPECVPPMEPKVSPAASIPTASPLPALPPTSSSPLFAPSSIHLALPSASALSPAAEGADVAPTSATVGADMAPVVLSRPSPAPSPSRSVRKAAGTPPLTERTPEPQEPPPPQQQSLGAQGGAAAPVAPSPARVSFVGATPLDPAAAAPASERHAVPAVGAAPSPSPSPFMGMPSRTPMLRPQFQPRALPGVAAAIAFSPAPAWPSAGGAAAAAPIAPSLSLRDGGAFAFTSMAAAASAREAVDLTASTPDTPADPWALPQLPLQQHAAALPSPQPQQLGFGSPQVAATAAAGGELLATLPLLAAEVPSPLSAASELQPIPDSFTEDVKGGPAATSDVAEAAPVPASTVAAAAAPAPPAGSNVVAAIRSFLPAKRPASPPIAAGRKQIKVRASETN